MKERCELCRDIQITCENLPNTAGYRLVANGKTQEAVPIVFTIEECPRRRRLSREKDGDA